MSARQYMSRLFEDGALNLCGHCAIKSGHRFTCCANHAGPTRDSCIDVEQGLPGSPGLQGHATKLGLVVPR